MKNINTLYKFKKSYLVLIVVLMIFSSIPIKAQVGVKWAKKYTELSQGAALSMAVDSNGNVYVTGCTEFSFGDYLTIKYNSFGVVQWSRSYNGFGNGTDLAHSIAVDITGNVYVTGESSGNGTDFDITTIKYNSDGNEQWIQRYNREGNSGDGGKSIAVDNSGNVYVCGYGEDSSAINSSSYVTIKYNSAGYITWIREYRGIENGRDDARFLAIDGNGNVYVTGGSQSGVNNMDYLTIKYNSNGVEQWVQRYNQYQNSYENVRSLAIDNLGNVYITGSSIINMQGIDHDYITIKYNSNGNPQWYKRYQGPQTGGMDQAVSIAVDAVGNVFVTGTSASTGVNSDYATIRYNSAGIEQWVKRYNGPLSDNWDAASGITIDNFGSVYVTGRSSGTGGPDYATVKYNSNGVEQWVNRFSMPGFRTWHPYAIKVDAAGNVYLTGDRTTVKCSQFNVQTTLLLPAYEAINQPLSFAFDWMDTPGSESYQLQVSDDPNFNSALIDQDSITASVFTIGEGSLSYLTKYYWRVRAFNGIVTGLWSEVWNFTTLENPPPPNGVPQLISPLNGSGNMPLSLTLDWSNVQGSFVTYDVQVSTTSRFTSTVVNRVNLSSSEYLIPYPRLNPILQPNTKYYWRARASSFLGTGAWSEVWFFSTGSGSSAPTGITQIGSEIPVEYKLYYNYPNPFNPATNIKFDIPHSGNVRIAVYDILGKEVQTLANEFKASGSYVIYFDASLLSSGTYFYQIKTGEFTDIKKMALIK